MLVESARKCSRIVAVYTQQNARENSEETGDTPQKMDVLWIDRPHFINAFGVLILAVPACPAMAINGLVISGPDPGAVPGASTKCPLPEEGICGGETGSTDV